MMHPKPLKREKQSRCHYEKCRKVFKPFRSTQRWCSGKCMVAENGFVKIKPVADDLAKEHRIYERQKKQYLIENPICAVYPKLRSVDVHHKKGRGKYLNDISTWLPVSRKGHDYIHDNPEISYEKGWMIKRTV